MTMIIAILLVASLSSAVEGTARRPHPAHLAAPASPGSGAAVTPAAREMPPPALFRAGSASSASGGKSAGTTPGATTSETNGGLALSPASTPETTPRDSTTSTSTSTSTPETPPGTSIDSTSGYTSTPEVGTLNTSTSTSTSEKNPGDSTPSTSTFIITPGVSTPSTNTPEITPGTSIESTSAYTSTPGINSPSTSTSTGTPVVTPRVSTASTSTPGISIESTSAYTNTLGVRTTSTPETTAGVNTSPETSTPEPASPASGSTASITKTTTGVDKSTSTDASTDTSPETSTPEPISTASGSTTKTTTGVDWSTSTDTSTETSTNISPETSTPEPISTASVSTASTTKTTTGVDWSTSTDTSTNTSTDTSTETSTDTSTETSTDTSTETSTDTSTATSTPKPTSTASVSTAPWSTSTDTSTETSTDTSTETSTDTSTETSTDTSTETSTETSTDTSTETSTDTSTETSTDTSTETSTDTSTETSTDTSTVTSTPKPTSTASVSTAPWSTSTDTSTPEPSPSYPGSSSTPPVTDSLTTTRTPAKCYVDPYYTTIEAQIIIPRTLALAWDESAPSLVEVCVQDDCQTSHDSSVQFGRVMPGEGLLVTVTGVDFYDCVELFVPWQFRIGAAAENLTLDWINVTPLDLSVCVARDSGDFPTNSSYSTCIVATGSGAYISGLEPDTPYWVKLGEATVFHTATHPIAKYRSLAFRCHEAGACSIGECRPATDGLLLDINYDSAVPESYPFVCVDKGNAQFEPVTIKATSGVLAVTSVVFESGGLEEDIEECIHTTAMAVVKYWCDGMAECIVDHSLLHSYLARAEGCVDTRLSEYSLHVENEEDPSSNLTCREGASLFAPHRTCYDMETSSDFLARRKSCMEAGGEIAFHESDPKFLEFLNETFSLSEEGFLVQGLIGSDARPRQPQLHAEEIDILHIVFDTHYVLSDHSSASELAILCAYPPLVGVPDRLETATIVNNPCLSDPCLNGGTCLNTTQDLNAESTTDDDFMCNCREGYSGDLCEYTYATTSLPSATSDIAHLVVAAKADERGSPGHGTRTRTAEEEKSSMGGFYSFSAPRGEALSFEYAYFGEIEAWSVDCYAPAALALIRLKCNGQNQCKVSYKDLHHHLHSSCHPAVPPTLITRHTSYEYSDGWGCAGEGDKARGCLGTSPDLFNDAQEAKLYCNGMGGDLASVENPTPSLCLNNASSLWVDNATDFRSHAHYSLTPSNPTSISCDGHTRKSSSALCVFPFVFSNETSTTTEETTTDISTTTSTMDTTTENTTTEITTTSTTDTTTANTTTDITTTSTTDTTTANTTTQVSTTVSTTSTTTTTTPKPPGPCPRTRPFPLAYPDYIWKEEQPGTLASKNCPKTQNVTVYWQCKMNGKWDGLPDLSACSTIDTAHWENEIANGNETAGDSLNNFVNMTESQELEPGDVTSTMDILESARERHIKDIQNMTETEALNATEVYTSAVTKATNKVLKQPQVWFGLPEEARANASTALQVGMEEAAVELAYLLVNESKTFETETVTINATRHSKIHYERDENRIFYHKDRAQTMVELPEKFFEAVDDDLVAVSFTSYSTLHCVLGKSIICEPQDLSDDSFEVSDHFPLPEIVNSPVMGLTIGNASWNFSDGQGVKATFLDYFGSEIYNLSTATCVSWDVAKEQWSPEGCEMTLQTGAATECTCSHLTNLAVIVDVNGIIGKSPFLQWFTVVGCSVSLVCLVLAIVTLAFLLHRRRRNKTTTIIHLHLCCCLFVAEFILLVGLDRTEDEVGCGVVAGFLHYFLLATFCWMGVEGVNVYFLVVKVFLTARSPLRYYTVVGYTAPALVVAISAAVDSGGYGTEDYCWLSTESGLIWAFTGPALVILLVNFVMFGFGVRAYLTMNTAGHRGGGGGGGRGGKAEGTSKGESRRLLRGSVILSSVLGLTWILGYFMMFGGSAAYAMAVLFTVVNSLQGAILFVVMVLMNPAARTQLKVILCCGREEKISNIPSSFTRSSRVDPSTSFQKELENAPPSIPRPVLINPRGSGELDMWVAKELQDRPTRRR